jgi:methylated-DNA-protein-cysteine methyltransferase-like protein
MNDEHVERVRELLAAVPPGWVTTYGDLATAAGLSSPRIVGRILAEDSADLAWHRVVHADGKPAPHKVNEQLQRLRAEGIQIRNERVDIDVTRWRWDGAM